MCKSKSTLFKYKKKIKNEKFTEKNIFLSRISHTYKTKTQFKFKFMNTVITTKYFVVCNSNILYLLFS